MASRLLRDENGASLVEATIALPLVMLLALGLVDLGLVMFSWAEANRATYAGARYAVTHAPLATGINLPLAVAGTGSLGSACFDTSAGGTGAATGYCQTRAATECKGSGATTVTCTGGSYTVNTDAFGKIVAAMQKQYQSRRLDYRQVSVKYEPLTLGFAGIPEGPPINVTVSLRCLKQEIFFLSAFMGWALQALPNDCAGVADSNGFTLPAFSTTLPSEDLQGTDAP